MLKTGTSKRGLQGFADLLLIYVAYLTLTFTVTIWDAAL